MGAWEKAEQKILCLAIQDAVRLAAEGHFETGRGCLAAGLERVREYVSGGETWAKELVSEYHRALGCFEEMVQHAGSTLRPSEHASLRRVR